MIIKFKERDYSQHPNNLRFISLTDIAKIVCNSLSLWTVCDIFIDRLFAAYACLLFYFIDLRHSLIYIFIY